MTALVAAAGLTLAGHARLTPQGRLALALVAAAYASYQYYALGHLFARALGSSTAPPLAVEALRLGEGLVVLAAAAAFWAWGAFRWRKAGVVGVLLTAAVVLVVAAAGSRAPSATASILALWTTGLSLYFPLPLYLLALGLYLITAVACLRDREGFWTGAGLLLVLVAGYMPEATYDHVLLLLGVLFVAGAAQTVVPGKLISMTGERAA
jgi:hypothetical protein